MNTSALIDAYQYSHPPIEHTVNIAMSFLFVTWKMRVIASYDDEER